MPKLVQGRDDFAVKLVNIDRKGAKEIDWNSPVVDQYGIDHIPFLMIYGKDGRHFVVSGTDAFPWAEKMLEGGAVEETQTS